MQGERKNLLEKVLFSPLTLPSLFPKLFIKGISVLNLIRYNKPTRLSLLPEVREALMQ
jgi:hypothetical protein